MPSRSSVRLKTLLHDPRLTFAAVQLLHSRTDVNGHCYIRRGEQSAQELWLNVKVKVSIIANGLDLT